MIKKYILASINIYALIFNSIIYLIGLMTIKIYPNYQNCIILCLLSLSTVISLLCYLNNNNKIYNIGIIATIILNVIVLYNINDLNNKYDYIDNITTNKYTYKDCNIYVQKKNPKYNSLKTLNNKNIGMLNYNSENMCAYLNKTITINCHKYETLQEIENALQTGEIQSFILSEEEKEALSNSQLEIKNQTRIIEKIKIKDSKN